MNRPDGPEAESGDESEIVTLTWRANRVRRHYCFQPRRSTVDQLGMLRVGSRASGARPP
jgi:hypothetical protein